LPTTAYKGKYFEIKDPIQKGTSIIKIKTHCEGRCYHELITKKINRHIKTTNFAKEALPLPLPVARRSSSSSVVK
jgi:hypothetical protein